MEISVVIPIYGSKNSLLELYERLKISLTKITEEYEIILVNDADPQGSWDVIEEICNLDQQVVGIDLSRNFGQIYAINAGLRYATGNWIVVMDCDLQDRPEEIIDLYQKAHEGKGYDVVFTKRVHRKDTFFKILLAKIFYKIYSYATDGNYDSSISNFSIVKKIVIDNYLGMKDYHRSYVIYIKWLGFRQTSIDVKHNERKEGKSSYNFKKRMKLAEDILVSQSDKILKLMARFGFFLTFASLISIIIIFFMKLVGNILPGWTSIVMLQFLLGGIIVFSIGIVGIYIGKIFMQTKGRPSYIVRQILNKNKEDVHEEK